jgi:hypothetical protein
LECKRDEIVLFCAIRLYLLACPGNWASTSWLLARGQLRA